MKVFCFARAGADIPHTQALCQWHRSWKDAGFEPFVLTPASCAEPLDIEHVLKASQQPEHIWARWNAHYLRGHEDMLLVTPTILPAIRAEQMPPFPRKPSTPTFVSYDTRGRVIYTYKSPANVMRALLRHDFSEFEGLGFSDWDLLLLDYTKSQTIDATYENTEKNREDAWFHNYTQEQILELRAKRLAL